MLWDQLIISYKISKLQNHLGYANEGQTSHFVYISATGAQDNPKLCKHMQSGEMIIILTHNKPTTIRSHLGYANNGQSSNIPLFGIPGVQEKRLLLLF